MYVHRRVAVQLTLPLGPERTDHTATRPSAYRFGTLDAIWQCETHCHSGLSVPPSYVHRRVAVWMTLPCTFTAEWQCNLHCHSGPSVPITLPLAPERTASVRSMPFGSVDGTAMYVHRRVAVSTRRQTPHSPLATAAGGVSTGHRCAQRTPHKVLDPRVRPSQVHLSL